MDYNCLHCQELKPYEKMCKRKLGDGSYKVRSICSSCKYKNSDNSKNKKRMKKYLENNREKTRERAREFRKNNKPLIKEYSKKYYERNKEKQLKRQREYYYRKRFLQGYKIPKNFEFTLIEPPPNFL